MVEPVAENWAKPEISTGRHHQSHGLGGSSRIIRAAGRIIKPGVERKAVHMMIPFNGGEAPFSFLTPFVWGRGGLWVKLIKEVKGLNYFHHNFNFVL